VSPFIAAIPGWEQLIALIGGVLNFFYQIVPNLGIAIIFLTLVIMLAMFPLTLKQTRSMRAMQEIQPEVKRLQKELKGDKEELNKQLMALYQERGVNPAAGCLPMIIQMPIWFALFQVLRNTGDHISLASGDSINTRFLGMDLTLSPSVAVPDAIRGGDYLIALPYILLLVLIIVAGFYQQLQTTRTKKDDGEQSQTAQSMQNAMKVMPIFFGFISWTLTSGLGIYFATSNLFRIGQQALIFRIDDRGDGDEKPAKTPGPLPEDGEPERMGPSPHASKKKNRRRRK
jgi:YidC/Oxa1 family membrane protein insertase